MAANWIAKKLMSKPVKGIVAAVAVVACLPAYVAAGTLTRTGLGAIEVVRAHRTDVFTVTFRAGETAMVAISGDGDSDLDLYVFDQNGNRVCGATGRGDDEVCRWTPRWTGTFRVEVRNLGAAANRYRIATN